MLNEGTKAPEFTLQDQNGKERSLSEFLGQKVVLFFYSKDMTSGCSKLPYSISNKKTLNASKR